MAVSNRFSDWSIPDDQRLTVLSFAAIFAGGLCASPYVGSGEWLWLLGYASACVLLALFARPLFPGRLADQTSDMRDLGLVIEPNGQYALSELSERPSLNDRAHAGIVRRARIDKGQGGLPQLDLLDWRRPKPFSSKILTEQCDDETVERVREACLAIARSKAEAERISRWFAAINAFRVLPADDFANLEARQRAASAACGIGWESARTIWNGRRKRLQQILSEIPSELWDKAGKS